MQKLMMAVLTLVLLSGCGKKPATPGTQGKPNFPERKVGAGNLKFSDNGPVFNTFNSPTFTPATTATFAFTMNGAVQFTILSGSHWYACPGFGRCTDTRLRFSVLKADTGQPVIADAQVGQTYDLDPVLPYILSVRAPGLTDQVPAFQLDVAVARGSTRPPILALICENTGKGGHSFVFTGGGIIYPDGTPYFTGPVICGHDRAPGYPFKAFFKPTAASAHDPNYTAMVDVKTRYQATLLLEADGATYHMTCAKFGGPSGYEVIEVYDDIKFAGCHYLLR